MLDRKRFEMREEKKRSKQKKGGGKTVVGPFTLRTNIVPKTCQRKKWVPGGGHKGGGNLVYHFRFSLMK